MVRRLFGTGKVAWAASAVWLAAGCSGPGEAGDGVGSVQMYSQKLVTGSLPGGTSIEVAITSPATGAVVPAGPVTVHGTAAVGLAPPVADTGIVYVIDVSGSTQIPAGCGGDANGDGQPNTVLDCEVASLLAAHATVSGAGTISEVGVVAFGSTAAAGDLSDGGGDTPLTAPATDGNGNGVTDVEEVVRSVRFGQLNRFTVRNVGTLTSFVDAINATAPVLAAMTATKKMVIFVSDGQAPTVGLTAALAAIDPTVVFHTFAVGTASTCVGGLDIIAGHDNGERGTCTTVTNPASLPDVIPGVVSSRLLAVVLTVDGGPLTPANVVTPALPLVGPASATFEHTVMGLTAGLHQLCAFALGSDGAGDGSVSECVSIRVNSPPVAVCTALTLPADAACGASGSINGGSSDPDGDAITCVQAPAGPYSLGTTGVTLTCTDTFGSAASCMAPVTVVDTTPPAFVALPAPVTIAQCRTPSLGVVTATDACGAVTVTNNAPTVFPLGTTVVTWTATDAAGNTATASQTVTAILGDDPSCCPAGTNIILGTNGNDVLVGTMGRDCILLRGGHDTCNSFGGDDFVSGGDGDDTIDTGDGHDVLFAGPGRDTVMTGNGNDRLDGGPGFDTCNAGGGMNTVVACERVN